ncbi:hypothetical protein BZL41_00250 [Pseudomonas sp. PIC25]|nr:hypothetical protein BZL41_00250 [Pseudomonas sp. PIC25]
MIYTIHSGPPLDGLNFRRSIPLHSMLPRQRFRSVVIRLDKRFDILPMFLKVGDHFLVAGQWIDEE